MGFTASSEYLRLIKNFTPQFQRDPALVYRKTGFEALTRHSAFGMAFKRWVAVRPENTVHG